MKLKSFGLAVAMALALTAFVGVSSATASSFRSQIEPTIWKGQPTNNHTFNFPAGGDKFTEFKECNNHFQSGLTASEVKSLTAKHIGDKTEKTEKGASLLRCRVELGVDFFAYMSTCEYRFRPGGEALVGTMDLIGCGAEPMHFSYSGCAIKISNQQGLGTVKYENIGSGSKSEIIATANLSSITYTTIGADCKAVGTFYDGTYTGTWSISGKNQAETEQVGVWMEKSPLPAPTVFAGEEAPVKISGKGTPWGYILVANGILYCNSHSLSAESGTVTTGSITLAPTYKECYWEIPSFEKATVSMGGCSYVLYASGLFDIAGAGCGATPMTITTTSCTITIGPQSGLSGLILANAGSGKLRNVSLKGSAKKLKFTIAGKGCFNEGTFSSGTFYGAVSSLTASNSLGVPQGLSIE